MCPEPTCIQCDKWTVTTSVQWQLTKKNRIIIFKTTVFYRCPYNSREQYSVNIEVKNNE
jgi:hypothetical protein